MATARYDGHAAWYDRTFAANGRDDHSAGLLARLVARGLEPGGVVVDVGCGTGLHFGPLQAAGFAVVGLDVSGDQLSIARTRSSLLLRADGAMLPLRDATAGCTVATFIQTDVEDFDRTVAEMARITRPGGKVIYIGLHPCFVGPFLDRSDEQATGRLVVDAGYGDQTLTFVSRSALGLATRVGSRHVPLTALLRAFTDTPLLALESFTELDNECRPWPPPGGSERLLPWNLAVVARRL